MQLQLKDPSSAGFYVKPINSGGSGQVLYYDTLTSEIKYGSAGSGTPYLIADSVVIGKYVNGSHNNSTIVGRNAEDGGIAFDINRCWCWQLRAGSPWYFAVA